MAILDALDETGKYHLVPKSSNKEVKNPCCWASLIQIEMFSRYRLRYTIGIGIGIGITIGRDFITSEANPSKIFKNELVSLANV